MSHETFEVGEIAVFHGLINDVELEGTECEIIGPFGVYQTRTGTCVGWRVRAIDGRTGPTKKLRKRRPPQDPAYLRFRDRLTRQASWLQSTIGAIRKEIERV